MVVQRRTCTITGQTRASQKSNLHPPSGRILFVCVCVSTNKTGEEGQTHKECLGQTHFDSLGTENDNQLQLHSTQLATFISVIETTRRQRKQHSDPRKVVVCVPTVHPAVLYV